VLYVNIVPAVGGAPVLVALFMSELSTANENIIAGVPEKTLIVLDEVTVSLPAPGAVIVPLLFESMRDPLVKIPEYSHA
jgi:hypothetical protein